MNEARVRDPCVGQVETDDLRKAQQVPEHLVGYRAVGEAQVLERGQVLECSKHFGTNHGTREMEVAQTRQSFELVDKAITLFAAGHVVVRPMLAPDPRDVQA